MYENVRFNSNQPFVIGKNGVRRRVYTKVDNQRIKCLPDTVKGLYETLVNNKSSLRGTQKSRKLRSGSIHARKAVSVVMHKMIGCCVNV